LFLQGIKVILNNPNTSGPIINETEIILPNNGWTYVNILDTNKLNF